MHWEELFSASEGSRWWSFHVGETLRISSLPCHVWVKRCTHRVKAREKPSPLNDFAGSLSRKNPKLLSIIVRHLSRIIFMFFRLPGDRPVLAFRRKKQLALINVNSTSSQSPNTGLVVVAPGKLTMTKTGINVCEKMSGWAGAQFTCLAGKKIKHDKTRFSPLEFAQVKLSMLAILIVENS